jgi:hypothetical protein
LNWNDYKAAPQDTSAAFIKHMTVPSKIQRVAAAIYPITALVLIVPIVWLAFKHRKEKKIITEL